MIRGEVTNDNAERTNNKLSTNSQKIQLSLEIKLQWICYHLLNKKEREEWIYVFVHIYNTHTHIQYL